MRGIGPTFAGSGRCREYVDEPICKADEQCTWRRGYQTKTGTSVNPLCVVRRASFGANAGARGRGNGTQLQKAAAANSDWIQRLKAYQAQHGVTYKEAMIALKGTGKGKKGSRMMGGYWY